MRLTAALYFLALLFTLAGCKSSPKTLFTSLDASTTGINFINQIEEDIDFNILTYEYLYNGGGVAVGDLNNDSLADIVFSGNMTHSRIYLNKGNMRFEDATSITKFNDRQRWKTGVVMADVNGDKLLDIYLCYSGPGTDADRANQLFINEGIVNGKPVFSEKAKDYGLDAPGTYSTTASFFDYDNDGDVDMFLVNHADMFFNPFFNTEKLRSKRHAKFGSRLYRNDNGFFNDVSETAGINGSGLNFGLSVSVSDINNDGWTDIYVTNDYDERDFLYLNNGNGSFRETLDKAAGHISEFAMGSDIADYNNDSYTDVVVLDMLPEDNHRQKLLKGADTYDKYTTRVKHGFHHQQMRNTLQLNNGSDSSGTPLFSEVGQLAGISKTDWSWAPLFADFDNDGWKDLFVSNGIFKDITNLDFVKYTSGYSNNFGDGKAAKPEMWELIKRMPSTKLNNYFFRNNGDLSFTDMSASWSNGKKAITNGSAYADLDNDGDLDMVMNCLNDAPFILQNHTAGTPGSNYLRLKLQGSAGNSQAIGARITIKTTSSEQLYEHFTSRGFQSSVDDIIHAGLGNDSIIREIHIKWPGGNISSLKNVKANRLITLHEADAHQSDPIIAPEKIYAFTDITAASGIDFVHQPSAFVDFKVSPLLPFQVSKIAPSIAAADVNGDGLTDLFIGSGTKQPNQLYLQRGDGMFTKAADQPWNNKKDKTIADALFIDADNDGDKDLYLVSGGADYYQGAANYQDEFYVNKGKGVFEEDELAIPRETSSGSCARMADYNKDGLPDMFIGNKYLYGQFPMAPQSVLLVNKSTRDRIRFEFDVQNDSSLFKQGMVADAAWLDIDNNGWPDLVTAGLFEPICVFINEGGTLTNRSVEYGLSGTEGWWCRILADDFDNDGNVDLVIGNLGNNNGFRANSENPVTITYSDYNNDGRIDPILSYYHNGISYPYFSRDELLEQLPYLQKKFGRYADYADARLEDIFTSQQLAQSSTVRINTLHSVYVSNKGKGKLQIKSLPSYAQMSMASGLVSTDINKDGKKDIVMAGNFYPMRVQMGPLDASVGLVLKNVGNGDFLSQTYSATGLRVTGDVRSLTTLKSGSKHLLVAASYGGAMQVISIQ